MIAIYNYDLGFNMIAMSGLHFHSNIFCLQHDYGNMVLENHVFLDPMKVYINVELLSHSMHKIESCYEAGCKHFLDNNKQIIDLFHVVFLGVQC